MSGDAVVTVLEGKRRLQELEVVAVGAFRASDEDFDKAMLALWSIYDERLWLFAEDEDGAMFQDYEDPQFGMYLRLFCARNNISRSGTYDHLKTIRVWQALGFDLEQLEAVGVKRARPMRTIVDVDGRTGEIELPSPEVIDNLPPGDSPLDRVRRKIEETLIQPEIPLTKRDVRQSFKIDTGAGVEYVFYEDNFHNVCCDFSSLDETWTGIVVPHHTLEGVPQHVARKVKRKLGVQVDDL